jgi:hypothetical protein
MATEICYGSKTYGGTGMDRFYSVIQTNDGGYLCTGNTQSFNLIYTDVYVVKTDGNGNELWSKTIGGILR